MAAAFLLIFQALLSAAHADDGEAHFAPDCVTCFASALDVDDSAPVSAIKPLAVVWTEERISAPLKLAEVPAEAAFSARAPPAA